MNDVAPNADPKRGILLNDTVDLDWIRSVTPRFYEQYIKFVVDFDQEQVYVGMDFHADCVPGDIDPEERNRRFRGGNLYFDDGRIVYESTLNVQGNLALGGAFDDIRIVSDADTVSRIDAVLDRWVVR